MQNELLAELKSLRTFFGVLVDHMDLEPTETRIRVNAVSPDGKRELATRSLAEAFASADATIAKAEKAEG